MFSDSDKSSIYDSGRRSRSSQVNTMICAKTSKLNQKKKLRKAMIKDFNTLDVKSITDDIIDNFDDPEKFSQSCNWIQTLAQKGLLNKVGRRRLVRLFRTLFRKLTGCITAKKGVLLMLETISAAVEAMPLNSFIPDDMGSIMDVEDWTTFRPLIQQEKEYTPHVLQITSMLLENQKWRYKVVKDVPKIFETLFCLLTTEYPECHKSAGYCFMNLLCRDNCKRVTNDHIDDLMDRLEQEEGEELEYQILSILLHFTIKIESCDHFAHAKGIEVCVKFLEHKSTRIVQKAINCIMNVAFHSGLVNYFSWPVIDEVAKLIGGDDLLITDSAIYCFANLCRHDLRNARYLVKSHDIVFVTMRMLETLEDPKYSVDFKTKENRDETMESALILLFELVYPVNTALSIRVCKEIMSNRDWCIRLCNVFKCFDATYNNLVIKILYSIAFNCPASHRELLKTKLQINEEKDVTPFDIVARRMLLSRDELARVSRWSDECWMFTIKRAVKSDFRSHVEGIFSSGCNMLLLLAEKNATARKNTIGITNSPELTPFRHLGIHVEERDNNVLKELLVFGNNFASFAPEAAKKLGENRDIRKSARHLAKTTVSGEINVLVRKFLKHIRS